MKLEKAKFVYIEWQADYEKYVLSKCEERCCNVFANTPPEHRKRGLLWLLYKLHQSPKINKKIPLPFRSVWNGCFLEKRIRRSLCKQDNIVFIFSGRSYKYAKCRLLKYLRRKFPNSCFLYVFSDKVELYYREDPLFSLEKLHSYFDFVLSYNDEDVEKYSLIKEPLKPYDFSDVENDEAIPQTDMFFVGKEKGRYADIISIFEKAKSRGLKCDFTILEVPLDQRLYKGEIEYEKRIPYVEMLKRERRAKSILNIMQSGTSGITLRDYEAFGMNKILITNSNAINMLPNYSENMVIQLENFDNEIFKLLDCDAYSSWKQPFAISYEEYYNRLEEIVYQSGEGR